MAELPKDAKHPAGFADPVIDNTGETVLFGFRFKGEKDALFRVDYKYLAETIHYLQGLADSAQQRRLVAMPNAAHTEITEAAADVLQTVTIQVDLTGDHAKFNWTTIVGTKAETQIEYELLVQLRDSLPGLVTEMEQRQEASKKAH